MSNRRRLKTERAASRAGRCPKCKSPDRSTKEYPDAFLHICQACQYPVREVKP